MSNPGRNDPCSCGSGKKFKKCCGAVKTKKKLQASLMTSGSTALTSDLFKAMHSRASSKDDSSSDSSKSFVEKVSLPNSSASTN